MEYKVASAWYIFWSLMVHCGMRAADAGYKKMVADSEEELTIDSTYARKYVRTYTPLGSPSTLEDDEYADRGGKREDVHAAKVRSMGLTAEGALIASLEEDGSHKLVFADENSCVKSRTIPSTSKVFSVLPWYENVFAVGGKGRIYYWNSTHNYMLPYHLPDCYPHAAAVHQGGDYAVIAATSVSGESQFSFFKHDGKNATVWSLTQAAPISMISSVTLLALHPKKYLFAVGLGSGAIRVWSIRTDSQSFAPVCEIESCTRSRKITALLYTVSHIISASSSNNILCWDTRSRKTVCSYAACHADRITALCAVDDVYFASGSVDGTVKLWDVRQSKCVDTQKHGYPVEALRLRAANILVSCSKNAMVRYWNLRGKLTGTKSKD